MKLILTYITAAIIIMGCCKKKDDPCEQVQNNPIKVKVEVPYGEIYGGPQVETLYYETDTMMSVVYPKFTVTGEFDSVKWIVGNNLNIYKQRSFIISFQDSVGTVPITCITYHQSNKDCYGGRISDTIIKNIFITSRQQAKIIGTYRGYTSLNPNDVFEFAINLNDLDYFTIKNFPNGGDSIEHVFDESWDRFYYNEHDGFRHVNPVTFLTDTSYYYRGLGQIINNDSIFIDITYARKVWWDGFDFAENNIPFKFYGKRIH